MCEYTTDIVVIGAGLSGLTAAIGLARARRSVLVIDRCTRPGGRCGTFELDGHSFTIGCNDFGGRIVDDLRALGAPVEFVPSTNFIDFGGPTLRLPPGPAAMIGLLRHAPAIARAVWRIRRGGDRPLGDLFSERDRGGFGFGLVSLLAYAVGTPPQDLRADLLCADFSRQYRYGHDRMVVPVGGPQAITDALVARLHALGARFLLDTTVSKIDEGAAGFIVHTSRGHFRAGIVLTTEPPERPIHRAGLKVAQVLFAVPRSFAFVDARSLIVSPPRADLWMRALDEGRWPDVLGYHVFADRETAEHRTLTGFVLAPRGVDTFDQATRERVLEVIERGLSRHLPAFREALQYRRLLDPDEWTSLHRLNPSLAREITPGRSAAASRVRCSPGLLHIGNIGDPPGDHACAAMLSGMRAAERALALR